MKQARALFFWTMHFSIGIFIGAWISLIIGVACFMAGRTIISKLLAEAGIEAPPLVFARGMADLEMLAAGPAMCLAAPILAWLFWQVYAFSLPCGCGFAAGVIYRILEFIVTALVIGVSEHEILRREDVFINYLGTALGVAVTLILGVAFAYLLYRAGAYEFAKKESAPPAHEEKAAGD